eukprot:m.133012 g.133012  ORF g.133012 m.133012 type:complete len:397 (-) comp17521_c0_seq1:188-1378(-)
MSMTSQETPLLSRTNACVVAAFIHDAVNQLSVLGGIAPAQRQRDPVDPILGEQVEQEIDGQRQMEREYDELIAERESLQRAKAPAALIKENEKKVREVARALKKSTQTLVRNLQEHPGALENMVKMQSERQHVEDVLRELHLELSSTDSVFGFVRAVIEDEEKEAVAHQAIEDARSSDQMVKDLKLELEDLERTTETDIQELDEEIAQLKDQLQETKARVALEGRYIKKEADVTISVASKAMGSETQALKNRIKELNDRLAEEEMCHAEIVAFAEKNTKILEDKSNEWNRKLEVDCIVQKQAELEDLKVTRAQDLKRLQELTKKYKEIDSICKSDRKKREQDRLNAQTAVRQLAAAIKIQAWWRGTLVRSGGGKKGKKGGKGAKKGKKGSKKKKKK